MRWITTKEEHASRIIRVVAEYFLTQKIKPADPKNARAWKAYVKTLADHHLVMRRAMKAKQTVDTAQCDALEHAVEDMCKMYLPAEPAL